MLLTRAPVSTGPKPGFTFDLHVLSLPPAFALSQDQTLRLITPGRANASTRDAPFGRVNVSARSHSLAHDCAGRAMRPSVNHAAACASLPRSSQCQRADDRTELPTQQKTPPRPPSAEANQTTAWEAGYYARPLRVSNGFFNDSAPSRRRTLSLARRPPGPAGKDSLPTPGTDSGCLEPLTSKPPGGLPDLYVVWRSSAATLRRPWLRQFP